MGNLLLWFKAAWILSAKVLTEQLEALFVFFPIQSAGTSLHYLVEEASDEFASRQVPYGNQEVLGCHFIGHFNHKCSMYKAG